VDEIFMGMKQFWNDADKGISLPGTTLSTTTSLPAAIDWPGLEYMPPQ